MSLLEGVSHGREEVLEDHSLDVQEGRSLDVRGQDSIQVGQDDHKVGLTTAKKMEAKKMPVRKFTALISTAWMTRNKVWDDLVVRSQLFPLQPLLPFLPLTLLGQASPPATPGFDDDSLKVCGRAAVLATVNLDDLDGDLEEPKEYSQDDEEDPARPRAHGHPVLVHEHSFHS